MIGIDVMVGDMDYMSLASGLMKGAGSALDSGGGADAKKAAEEKKKLEEAKKAAESSMVLYRNIAIGGGVALLAYLLLFRKPAPSYALQRAA